jgi:hypothetical protein
MPFLITWIGSWALKSVTGAIGESAIAILAPFVQVPVNLVVGGLVDLSKTTHGRIFMMAVIVVLSGWWVEAHYTYVSRSELASLQAQVTKLSAANAQLGKRPAAMQAENARLLVQAAELAKRPEVCPTKKR